MLKRCSRTFDGAKGDFGGDFDLLESEEGGVKSGSIRFRSTRATPFPLLEDHPIATSRIQIIGIGDDGIEGLTKYALERIEGAEVLIGPASLLQKVQKTNAIKEVIGADLDRMTRLIEDYSQKQVVLLASGDPLFYGTARFLCERLGKELFEVVPHVSSMQLAFARVKESWDEAYLTNLANQTIDRAAERIRSAEKVGMFTSESYPPNRVAEFLISKGLDYFQAYVCENLGSPDERVTRGFLNEIAKQSFSPLNVMILVRKAGTPDKANDFVGRRLFGNPDELFLQSRPKRGLLTPSEVRSIALAEMQLQSTSIVWDVGAGSGSVAIEAAQLANQGLVFAIEMDAEDYSLLVENAQRFGAANVKPVLGEAPTAWSNLPDPDSIFVGGTGRVITELVRAGWPRLRSGGCLVANVASIENVASLESLFFDELNVEPMVWMIQLARANNQMGRSRLESANPSFLIKAIKP